MYTYLTSDSSTHYCKPCHITYAVVFQNNRNSIQIPTNASGIATLSNKHLTLLDAVPCSVYSTSAAASSTEQAAPTRQSMVFNTSVRVNSKINLFNWFQLINLFNWFQLINLSIICSCDVILFLSIACQQNFMCSQITDGFIRITVTGTVIHML